MGVVGRDVSRGGMSYSAVVTDVTVHGTLSSVTPGGPRCIGRLDAAPSLMTCRASVRDCSDLSRALAIHALLVFTSSGGCRGPPRTPFPPRCRLCRRPPLLGGRCRAAVVCEGSRGRPAGMPAG